MDSILLPRPHALRLYILYIFLSIGNSSFYTFLSTFFVDKKAVPTALPPEQLFLHFILHQNHLI
ncbi:hypothetical protein DWY36_10030 [Firmicutes bacterium AF25-13AC]|nr:hypothetical protein DWY36_10030 [Firmicutes bacterium AF25-13AC]